MKANWTVSQVAGGNFKQNALAVALLAILSPANPAYAQSNEENGNNASTVEEVVVTGTIRDTIRNSIELKRESSTIVDAISASDIGTLPDLSVGETLERITGVTADRFKGQSNELSIRGLGPYLVFSTYNGREVSSGSGNRSVAFSQFPSELVNKAVVYKAQQADIIEGGVAGSINLASIRPIDYGKRRIQGELKLNYNEYQAKFKDHDGTGYRGSLSYTDVFDTSAGKLGFAIGVASTTGTAPQEIYSSSSVFRPCNSDGLVDVRDVRGDDRITNCSFSPNNDGVRNADGKVVDRDFYWVSNGHTFRQVESDDTRDAIITTLQYQPNDDWDITLDYQFSNRFFNEDRHELALNDGRRAITNVSTTRLGGLRSYTGNSRFSTQGNFRERDEDYEGAGINVVWQTTDNLQLSADLSMSSTVRTQQTWSAAFRSERYWYDFETRPRDFAVITGLYETVFREQPEIGPEIENFKETRFNDLGFFTNGDRRNGTRAEARDLRNEDDIYAIRFRADYDLNLDFFTGISVGMRASSHDFNFFAEERETFDHNNDIRANELNGTRRWIERDVADVQAAGCAIEFPQEDFGSDSSTTISEWATFDTRCAFDALVGDNTFSLDPSEPSAGDIILNEKVKSAFVMASFDTEIADIPVSGNLGVRVVQNKTDSTGYRVDYNVDVIERTENDTVSISAEEVPESVVALNFKNEYTNVLPSVNLNFAISEDVNFRVAAYRSVSRPDMWWLGSGRNLRINSANDVDDFSSFGEVIEELGQLNARGNPFMESIESDNLDLALSFYPTDDTLISWAVYHKRFNAGFGPSEAFDEDVDLNVEVFEDNGTTTELLRSGRETFTFPVTGQIEIKDEVSFIFGTEITVKHTFANLPSPFDGFGVSAGYNYADTNFETSEARNEVTSELNDIKTIFPLVVDIDDFVEPAALNGFSRQSYNFETFYEKYGFQARLAYKFRSEYLRQFGNNLNSSNNYNGDQDALDASLSYKITKNLSVRFQALNLLNKPLAQSRSHRDNHSFTSYNGRKYFLGLKFRI